MKLFPLLAVVLTAAIPTFANAALALQGKMHACKNASYMQLWDSASSALVKHQMLLDESCWKPMKGIHVEVLDNIGKFSRIQYVGNGIVAYTYGSDLKKIQLPPPEPAKTTVVRTADGLKRVSSLTEDKEVMLFKGKATVNLYFSAGKDSVLEITILKESLKSNFRIKIEDQKSGIMQIGVKHKARSHGLGKPDYVEFEVLERNDQMKYMDVRVSGYWNKFDRDRNVDFEIKPATIRISGAQFTEAVRPHSAKELQKLFRDYNGNTT